MTISHDPRDTFYDPEAPIQPWQQSWEFSKVIEIFDKLQPCRILEIGTYHGGTLYQWIKRSPKNAQIVTVDINAPDAAWSNWVRKYNKKLHVIRGDSTNENIFRAIRNIQPESDFLFIDGDHHYEAVKQDWERYSKGVRSGGVVVFHDILFMPSETWVRVDKLWEEIKFSGFKTEEWYIKHDQGIYGTGVVYV